MANEQQQSEQLTQPSVAVKPRLTTSQQWLALTMVLATGWLIYLLAPVLTPFAVAALFAYLGDPIADWLESKKLSRTLSVVIVFTILSILITILLLVLIPTLNNQIGKLIDTLPGFFEWARQKLEPLAARLADFGINTPDKEKLLEMVTTNWQEAGGIVANLLSSISRSGMAVVGWTMNLLLIPVVTFYLLRDWDILKDRVRALLPRHVEPTVTRLAEESNSVLGSFLRGQLSVMLALGFIYSVGLWIVGLDLGILIGMVAGLISFVPYLGTIVGVALGVVAALFQFGDINHLIAVLVVFGIGQVLEGVILTPLLVGDRIGLHPVAVIFAVLAGGQLFGFLGVLLALPAASVIMVLLRHAHQRYKRSSLYGELDESRDEHPPDGEAIDPPPGSDDPNGKVAIETRYDDDDDEPPASDRSD